MKTSLQRNEVVDLQKSLELHTAAVGTEESSHWPWIQSSIQEEDVLVPSGLVRVPPSECTTQ